MSKNPDRSPSRLQTPTQKKEIRNWCSPFLLFWLSPPHVFPSFSTFFCCAIEASSPFPSFFSSSVIFPSPPPILPLPICHRFQVGTGRLKLKNGRQHYETCPTVLKYVAEWETFIFLAILRHTSRPFVLGSTLILLLQRRHREKEKEEKKNKETQELRQWTFQQPKAKRRLRGPRGKEKTKTIFHWLLLLFQPLNNWFREISISPKKREKLPAHKIAGTTFFSWKTCVKARKKRG